MKKTKDIIIKSDEMNTTYIPECITVYADNVNVEELIKKNRNVQIIAITEDKRKESFFKYKVGFDIIPSIKKYKEYSELEKYCSFIADAIYPSNDFFSIKAKEIFYNSIFLNAVTDKYDFLKLMDYIFESSELFATFFFYNYKLEIIKKIIISLLDPIEVFCCDVKLRKWLKEASNQQLVLDQDFIINFLPSEAKKYNVLRDIFIKQIFDYILKRPEYENPQILLILDADNLDISQEFINNIKIFKSRNVCTILNYKNKKNIPKPLIAQIPSISKCSVNVSNIESKQ